jgi:hypothetical protein
LSGSTAIWHLPQSLSRLFFSPFLFDGKPSIGNAESAILCTAREILFDGYLMERLRLRSLSPIFFAVTVFSELICKFFDFSADSSLSFRLSSTH